MAYPKSRIGKRSIKKADLLRDLDPALTEVESELDALTNSVVSTLVDLTALPARVDSLARVTSLGCLFLAVPLGTSVADGITLIEGSNVQWQRIIATSDAKWQLQASWYVNAVSGNDENPGTEALPVRTTDEIQRRWGVDPRLQGPVTITLVQPPTTISLRWFRANASAIVVLQGVPTTLLETTLSAVSPIVAATNHWLSVEGTDIADWTPWLNKRIRFPDRENAIAWVAKTNPEGLGLNVARLSSPFKESNVFSIAARYVPVVGDRILVEEIPTIQDLVLIVDGHTQQSPTTTNMAVRIESLRVSRQGYCKLPPNGGYDMLVRGCDLTYWQETLNANTSMYWDCRIRASKLSPGWFYGCLISDIATRIFTNGLSRGDCYFYATLFETSLSVNGAVALYDCGFFDCVEDALYIEEFARVNQGGYLIGRDNSKYGIWIRFPSQLFYGGGSSTRYLTGASGDIFVYNLGPFPYSSVPFYFGHGSGKATLVAGEVIVSIPNLRSDASIVVTRRTPGGVIGDLSVPDATRLNLGTPTAQVKIVSSSATDTSTVDYMWESPWGGTGGIYRH